MLPTVRNKLMASVNEAVTDEQLLTYFSTNPQPTDEQIHQLAADHGLTPDQLEDQIYRLFGKALSEIRQQEASITVTAAVELAAEDNVPTRTVLMKAGGVGELRKLPANKALTLIRKAAGELSKERKAAGKTYKIDKEALTQWISDNCASGKSKAPTKDEKPAAEPKAPAGKKKLGPDGKPLTSPPAEEDDADDDRDDRPAGKSPTRSKAIVRPVSKERSDELDAMKPADAKALAVECERILKTTGNKKSDQFRKQKARGELKYLLENHADKLSSKAPAKSPKAKELPPSQKFADGQEHSKRVTIGKDGNLSVGNTKLVEKGQGFVLHWKDGKDEEKVDVKSLADVTKVGNGLKKDWDEWVKQYKAGDVTAQQLKQVKEGYEEYVALLGKAKLAFGGAKKSDLADGDKPAQDPKERLKDVQEQLRKNGPRRADGPAPLSDAARKRLEAERDALTKQAKPATPVEDHAKQVKAANEGIQDLNNRLQGVERTPELKEQLNTLGKLLRSKIATNVGKALAIIESLKKAHPAKQPPRGESHEDDENGPASGSSAGKGAKPVTPPAQKGPKGAGKLAKDMDATEVLEHMRDSDDPKVKEAVTKLDAANKLLTQLNQPGQSPANRKRHSDLLKQVDEVVRGLRQRISKEQEPAKPAGHAPWSEESKAILKEAGASTDPKVKSILKELNDHREVDADSNSGDKSKVLLSKLKTALMAAKPGTGKMPKPTPPKEKAPEPERERKAMPHDMRTDKNSESIKPAKSDTPEGAELTRLIGLMEERLKEAAEKPGRYQDFQVKKMKEKLAEMKEQKEGKPDAGSTPASKPGHYPERDSLEKEIKDFKPKDARDERDLQEMKRRLDLLNKDSAGVGEASSIPPQKFKEGMNEEAKQVRKLFNGIDKPSAELKDALQKYSTYSKRKPLDVPMHQRLMRRTLNTVKRLIQEQKEGK